MNRLFFLLSFLLTNILYLPLSDASSQERIGVVVSIYPLKDIVEQVGGERVRVDYMIPPGASPHTFEPKPSDIKRLNRANLLFLIGGGLEFWAEKVVSALNKKPRVIVLSKGLSLLKEKHSHGAHDRYDKREFFDPHIWLDPIMVMTMVDRIRDVIADSDPSNRIYYAQRAERFKDEIMKLHLRIEETAKRFRTREFVTFHSAWNYFAKRYGLRIIGIIEESPGKEASPAHIAKIVKEIRETKVKVVFVEPQFNPKAAEVIAKETGAKVFILDPIGGPDIKGRASYIGLMNHNLSVLASALR